MQVIVDVMGKQGVLSNLLESVNEIIEDITSKVILVGDKSLIQSQINSSQIEIIDAPSHKMSLNEAITLLKQDTSQALLTAETIKQVAQSIAEFPHLSQSESFGAGTMLMKSGHPMTLIDSGFIAEPTPTALIQFAQMSHVYFEVIFNHKSPRIGILSNGEEEGKGTQVIKETGSLLQKSSLNYIGNVEPLDVIQGDIEIVITDTYTADIFLKTFVPAMKYLSNIVRHQMPSSVFIQIGKGIAQPAIKRMDDAIEGYEGFEIAILGTPYPITLVQPEMPKSAIKRAISNLDKALQSGFTEKVQQSLLTQLTN